MPVPNPNSILFLYEGETELEFYRKIFDLYIPKRKIQIRSKNLEGIRKINKKVKNAIFSYLDNYSERNKIHVLIAHDREGTRDTPSCFNARLLHQELKNKNIKRIVCIKEIIATQDIESWFFNDIIGIYKFLKVPRSQRNLKSYSNTESTNNRTLARLFYRYNKYYYKGKRVEGFINNLDIEKIYNSTPDLQKGIKYIISLCKG